MNNPAIEISRRPALSAAAALLESAGLPTEDLTAEHCDHFFYCGPADAPSGLVGLEVLGDIALLRSLVVSPGDRRAGVGSALVRHAEDYARQNGVRVIYLLTTTAETFFRNRGYVRIARETAPTAIRSTREFSSLCPASSAFMSRQI